MRFCETPSVRRLVRYFATQCSLQNRPCSTTITDKIDVMSTSWPEAAGLFAHKMQRSIGPRKFHLSTDAFGPYRKALPAALAGRINYGQIIKIFGKTTVDEQRKYSPAKTSKIKKEAVWGEPNKDQTCTSHIERHDLMRWTFVRRMSRLTCAFSKKWENHKAMIGFAIFHYNYCRKHGTLKTTPAVANGLTDQEWTVRELISETSNK